VSNTHQLSTSKLITIANTKEQVMANKIDVSQYNEILKANAIKLAKDHIQNCHSSECDISLYVLGLLVERAGIKLSDEDWKVFL